MPLYPTTTSIRDALSQWRMRQGPIVPMDEDDAALRLQQSGMTAEEIAHRQQLLHLAGEPAPKSILAGYNELHALDRLDQARQALDQETNPDGLNRAAVLQAAEIAWLNILDMAPRVEATIVAGDLGAAREHYQWISSYEETLHDLSKLMIRLPGHEAGCDFTLADSPHASHAMTALRSLHRSMMEVGLTEPGQLNHQHLSNHGRALTHHAFVDTNYADLWQAGFGKIHLPGIQPRDDEPTTDAYARLLGTAKLERAVNELDQHGSDNYLRQFRSYHQMSEILVHRANRLIADSIDDILNPRGNMRQAQRRMEAALSMLAIANDNLVPITRNLSINRYEDIRVSLGITSGSFSPNLKGSLFKPLYELYVEAVKFRVMGLKPYKEEQLATRLDKILEDPDRTPRIAGEYQLLRQALGLHQSLATWRGLHMQLVKHQLGASASISGSANGLATIVRMRHQGHGEHDPIASIYSALTGQDYVPAPGLGQFFAALHGPDGDTFTTRMLNVTDQVAHARAEDVNARGGLTPTQKLQRSQGTSTGRA